MNYDIVLQELLERHFGIDEFISGQKEIISNIIYGKDVLAFVHRGNDRSVCYKLPALVIDGIVVIVSRQNPMDEANGLLPSVYISNSPSIEKRIHEVIDGKYKLVYAGPEQFQNRSFLFALNRIPLSLLVIDNAECISHYGYDFNPHYLNIPRAIADLDTHPTILALSGACTEQTRDDILNQLNMNLAVTPDVSCNCSLEAISIPSDKEKLNVLSNLMRELNGQGIIYTNTRNKTIEICNFLNEIVPDVSAYHGGMSREKRSEVERNFDNQKLRIITATSFLTLKLKISVSYVIYFDMPDRLERYYNQVVMAGQSDQPARCVLIYSPSDKIYHHSNIERGTVSTTEIWRISDMLKRYWKNIPAKPEPRSKKVKGEKLSEWLNNHFISLTLEARKELLKFRNIYENLNEWDKNPYSPDEYDHYLESEHWKSFTSKMFDEYEQCQVCESKAEHVHHLSYRNLGKEGDEDVVALCSKCHCYIHPDNPMTKKIFEERQESEQNQLSFLKDDVNSVSQLTVVPYEQIEIETGLDRSKFLTALAEMQNAGMLEIMPDCSISARVNILIPHNELLNHAEGEVEQSLVKWLIEKDEGDIDINLLSLGKELNCSPDTLEHSFLALNHAKCLSFRAMRKGIALHLIDLDVMLSEDTFEKLKATRYGSLRLVEDYVNTKRCRWNFLCEHLLSDVGVKCGKCDNCVPTKREKSAPTEYISVPDVIPEKERIPIVILSCAEKTDGLVGRRDMAKLLLGQKAKRILRYGFDHVEEFGCLSEMPKKEVIKHIDYLIERGCLEITSLFFPMIQLTDIGRKRLARIRS
jgi:ATP-dependent DNA helicase RecQ